jgi:TadE-like protein
LVAVKQMFGVEMMALLNSMIAAASRKFLRQSEGFAAVEFAMVVPIMIAMFIGTVEMSEAYTISRRVVTIAGSVADLVTQTDKLNDGNLDDIMRIADSLLAGYDTTKLEITVISVVADAKGNTSVDWSYDKQGGEPYAQGSPYNELPIGLIGPNGSVVVAQAKYKFTPPIGQNFVGSVVLSEKFHLQPRQSSKVEKVL